MAEIGKSQKIAEAGEFIRVTVGSQLHGVNLEGTDDHDEMGVCFEPTDHVIGLRHFEQWVYRTQPEGVRSGPGDIDRTVYSARKYLRLACGGNPTILMLLFAPPEFCLRQTESGRSLQALAPSIISRRCGYAFMGYMDAQMGRLTGERGQARVNRPELIEKYGYDTKFAMHALRLGIQGVELMVTKRLTLPMEPCHREFLLAVRRGEVPIKEVIAQLQQKRWRIESAIQETDLPSHPNEAAVDAWLIEHQLAFWLQGERAS